MPANQLSSTEEKADLSTYWFVEANSLQGDWPSQRFHEYKRFIKQGIWKHNSPDNTSNIEKTRAMKPGERIAIKDFFVKSSGLPFSTCGGNAVPVMEIKVLGVIKANNMSGEGVEVRWCLPEKPRKWYFYAQDCEVWGVRRGEWKDDALIDFAFYDVSQDINSFHADYPWRTRDLENKIEEICNPYVALLESFASIDISREQLELLDPQDLEAIYELARRFLDDWVLQLYEDNPQCPINFNDFDWNEWESLRVLDDRMFGKLFHFLVSISRLVSSLICIKDHIKEVELMIPEWAQEQYDELSETDKDVLYLLCQGSTNQEIAFALHMSIANVKKRASDSIYKSLKVTNRTGAVRFISDYKPKGSQNRRRK